MFGFGMLLIVGLSIYIGWGLKEQIPPEPKYPEWNDEWKY